MGIYTLHGLKPSACMCSEGYCSWVCVSVCLSCIIYGAFFLPETAVTYSVGNRGQKISGDLPETTAFKNMSKKANILIILTYLWSAFSAWHITKLQRVPNNYQQHSAFPKTMPTNAATPCWRENWEDHMFTATMQGVTNFWACALA